MFGKILKVFFLILSYAYVYVYRYMLECEGI